MILKTGNYLIAAYDERYRHSNSTSSAGPERVQRGGPSSTQTSPYGRGYNAATDHRLSHRQDGQDYRSRNSDIKDLSGRREVSRTTSLDERSLRKMEEMHKMQQRHELSFNGARSMPIMPRNDNEGELFSFNIMRVPAVESAVHEIHETCPSITFYLRKKLFDISRNGILPP